MAEQAEGLADKHVEFVPLIAAIEKIEESVGESKPASLRLSTIGLHESLAHGLIPHAVGEGRTVFPVLRRVTGSEEVASEMNREHREIARLTDELERTYEQLVRSGMNAGEERRLTELLGKLRGAIRQHFAAEEEACFRILKAELEPDEAEELCLALDRAAAEVRAAYE